VKGLFNAFHHKYWTPSLIIQLQLQFIVLLYAKMFTLSHKKISLNQANPIVFFKLVQAHILNIFSKVKIFAKHKKKHFSPF